MFKELTLNVLQKQYGYTNISDLLLKRAAVWDKYIGNISDIFIREVLDFNTCTAEALDNYWGKIFKISRTFKDNNDQTFTLTDEQFREIIKIKAFGISWQGDLASMNAFLYNLFKDRGTCFVVDNQNMTTQMFSFLFTLEDWERYLFTYKDILPRPAGIGTSVIKLSDDLFGFDGSGLQPFNQAPFFSVHN